jgi:chemotaxis protein methyltransferase CheR
LHNLLSPLDQDPFDCVFIKNVLIYFDTRSKQRVTTNLINSLAKGGYLVVGPTEGIYSMLGSLEKIKPWLYRRPAG